MTDSPFQVVAEGTYDTAAEELGLADTQTIAYEHSFHGRYEVPVSFMGTVGRDVDGSPADAIRELAENMTDGDTDLSDVTDRVALLVILASLRYEHVAS